MSDDQFGEEVRQLVDEHPKLDAACKNLIALISAKSAHTGDSIPPLELIQCARVLLKQLNAHELVDVVEWGSAHPQGPEQLAMDRIQQITQYKVVRALRTKATDMGGKITKLFGKSYILWSACWKQVRQAAMKDMPATVADHTFSLFMDTFELSLALSLDEQSGLVDVDGASRERTAAAGDDSSASAGAAKSSIDGAPDLQESVSSALLRRLALDGAGGAGGSVGTTRLHSSTLHADKDLDLVWAADFSKALQSRREEREHRIQSTKQAEWQDVTSNADVTAAGNANEKLTH